MALAGMSFRWLRGLIVTTGLATEIFDIWRAACSVSNDTEFHMFDVDDMYMRLKVARAKKGAGWTLSQLRAGAWSQRVAENIEEKDNFYDLCQILKELAERLVDHAHTNWQLVFVLEPSMTEERRRVVRYLKLKLRGFSGTPDSMDELDRQMDMFDLRTGPTEPTERTADSDELALFDISPQRDSDVVINAETVAPPVEVSTVPVVRTGYQRRRRNGFTALQDTLILERARVMGTRPRWEDVYDPEIFPTFSVDQVRQRCRWLRGRGSRR